MKAWQRKLLIYGIAAVVGILAVALIAGLVFRTGAVYAILFGVAGGAVSVTAARLIYHLYLRDYAPEMWQITIYMLLAAGGWLGAVLATTWGWVSLWLAMMSIGILMALGTRFCKAVAVSRTKTSLEDTLRYRYIDDKLGGTPDLDHPLTVVINGQALTVAEADAAGEGEAAKSGREYIKLITEGK